MTERLFTVILIIKESIRISFWIWIFNVWSLVALNPLRNIARFLFGVLEWVDSEYGNVNDELIFVIGKQILSDTYMLPISYISIANIFNYK